MDFKKEVVFQQPLPDVVPDEIYNLVRPEATADIEWTDTGYEVASYEIKRGPSENQDGIVLSLIPTNIMRSILSKRPEKIVKDDFIAFKSKEVPYFIAKVLCIRKWSMFVRYYGDRDFGPPYTPSNYTNSETGKIRPYYANFFLCDNGNISLGV